MKRIAVAALALLALTGASAPSRVADWITADDPVTTIDATLKDRDRASVPFVRLTPRTAYRLDGDVIGADGKLLLAKGTNLVGLRGEANTACQILGKMSSRFTCLRDADGDHVFESYFRVAPGTDFFFTSRPSTEQPAASLSAPVRYTLLSASDAPKVEMTLYFNRAGGRMSGDGFGLCVIGITMDGLPSPRNLAKFCLQPEITVPPSKVPMRIGAFGGRIAFLAKHDGAYDVQVTRPPAGMVF